MKGTRGQKILVLFCSLFLFPRWLSGWMITALLTRRDVLSWCRPFRQVSRLESSNDPFILSHRYYLRSLAVLLPSLWLLLATLPIYSNHIYKNYNKYAFSCFSCVLESESSPFKRPSHGGFSWSLNIDKL